MSDGSRITSFNSPTDFLRAVQNEMADPPADDRERDQQFLRVSRERAAKLGVPAHVAVDRLAGHARVLTDIHEAVLRTVAPHVADDLRQRVAVGLLDAAAASAFITKSADDKHAVLVSSGLMTILHKCSKFTTAAVEPGTVISCNRATPSTLTSGDFIAYKLEFIETQRQEGVSRGAMIHLEETAAAMASGQLCLAELFVVSHELGHFVNGDLRDGASFSMVGRGGWIRKFEENEDHAREYRADLTAYGIAEKAMVRLLPSATNQHLLLAAISLFDDLYLLAGGPSSSHPNPLDRAVHLVMHALGERAADALVASYDDPQRLSEVFQSGAAPDDNDR